MTNKFRTKWVLAAACVLAWAAASGVAIAGSPSKKPPSVNIDALSHSAAEAANSGDYFTASRLYRQLAEKGDARGQNMVGVMIADSDPKEAVKWFKLAAAQGYGEAEFRLGWMYEEGNGVPRDKDEAVKWYQLAAAHGYLEAEYKLGTKVRPSSPVAVVPQPRLTSPNNQQAQIIAGYEKCNSNAKERYNANWNDNCARIHEKESDDYYTCLQNHPGTQYNNDPWGCGRIYRTNTESKDCKLPILLADSLKHDFERAQDMCSREYGLH
jgi:TPR repeat protein